MKAESSAFKSKNGITIDLNVTPGAKSDGFTGTMGERLKIRVRGKAAEGKANDGLCQLLAQTFAVPKSAVTIIRGETSRQKTVFIMGEAEKLKATLNRIRMLNECS
ncbi:MAG TPA: DUF167 domain-containing protein [Candidatus Obscuribacterales bacterium]